MSGMKLGSIHLLQGGCAMVLSSFMFVKGHSDVIDLLQTFL